MKPGSVLVDISIDQGGCFEYSRPTTHSDPTYRVHDSIFYCVANMPGAVPHTSTYALTNVTVPYAVEIADRGWRDALRADPSLAQGLNTYDGAVTCAPVADAHSLPCAPQSPRSRLTHPKPPRDPAECAFDLPRSVRIHRRVASVADAVREYLQYLVVERGLAANTVESYQRDLRRYAELLAARGTAQLLDDVRTPDVAAFLAALRTGDEEHPPLATSSAGRAVVAVRGLHAFALKQGLASADPAREVAPPAPPRRLPRRSASPRSSGCWMPPGRPEDPDPRVLRDRALL